MAYFITIYISPNLKYVLISYECTVYFVSYTSAIQILAYNMSINIHIIKLNNK